MPRVHSRWGQGATTSISHQVKTIQLSDVRRQAKAPDTPHGLLTFASYGLDPIAERTTRP